MAQQQEEGQQAVQQAQLLQRVVSVPEKFEDGDVEMWVERFDLTATANGWDADMKLRLLPTLLKGRAYAVYRQMTAEQKGNYAELTTHLKRVFSPTTIESRRLARRQFMSRCWKSSEALEVYAQDLETLLTKAMPNLAAELRDQQLMDRFVEGLIDNAPSVAGELDLHPEASFQAAVIRARELMLLERRKLGKRTDGQVRAIADHASIDVSLAERLDRIEQALQSVSVVGASVTPDSKRVVPMRQQQQKAGRRCFACGGEGHLRSNCKQVTIGPCFVCHETGHLARDCPQRMQQSAAGRRFTLPHQSEGRSQSTAAGVVRGRGQRSQVNVVAGVTETSLMLNLELNHNNASCLVDTGAVVSIVPDHMVDQTAMSSFPSGQEPKLTTVTGDPLEVIGQVSIEVKIGHWHTMHKFVVVQFDTCPIIGSDFLLDHGMILDLAQKRLEWSGGVAELSTPLR
ncbi:uncharacterized protein LOC134188605 [Corticium candelabrum]|uniref:uncharacterized protein LOC134188605 n=1 Tax=Corticium candelabrum TaxID=121492 RepID=UPI002E25FF30|nr:uncharacterized protein LOC134188605 [Corticium candelabrum]